VEMQDYLHATKVGQHSTVELAQSYLKGYASTSWKTMRKEERKTHGYTWEFFKERIESEFIPNAVLHFSRRRREEVDSRLLVVGSQTASLTPGPSFAHNLG